jgi:glutamate/tyrosine decarboxylase-like PLP-dependent enzyme
MTDPQPVAPSRDELPAVLDLVVREARAYLESVDARPVLSQAAETVASAFTGPLPQTGSGAATALRELLDRGLDATATTSGPRYFHFVTGGVTPAALGADWLAGLLDQPAYAWLSSPLGVQLELASLAWLKDLFQLPADLAGIMTTGATMANFVGLAAARQWWAERHGIDVSEDGFADLPPASAFSSGHVHASVLKVLALLGLGRQAVERFTLDSTGRLDARGLEQALEALEGTPAILIANAGEVNAGAFDPIETMADLARTHDAWLHVDGAFGLFARVTPRTAALAAGAERADSITVDGHKWLNVPYDCGFAFVRDTRLLNRAFAYDADYLPDPDDPHPTLGGIGPESSRRARALAVWATLRAYGRSGYRSMVERHLDLARRLARRVDEAPELERLAEVPLNIVCFRLNPGDRSEVALRPALVNWRTRPEDVDLFVDVVRDLGRRLLDRPG